MLGVLSGWDVTLASMAKCIFGSAVRKKWKEQNQSNKVQQANAKKYPSLLRITQHGYF